MTSMTKKIAIVGPAGIGALARKELAARCSALTRSNGSAIPLGTKIPNYGEVSGVTFRDGERYYFLTGGAVSLMPASVIEKIPLQNGEI